jgi:hypothetical protein
MIPYSDIKILYTGGCSFFTRAYDFNSPSTRKSISKNKFDDKEANELSFPKLLGSKLNLPLVNDAKAGHSNAYSIRSAYEFLRNKPKQERAVAVMGLTDLARRELPILGTDRYHPISPSDYHFYNKTYKQDIDISKLEDVLNNYYQYMYNDNTEIKELIQQLNMLSSYADHHNTQMIFFCSFTPAQNYHEQKDKLSQEIFNTSKNIFDFFNFGHETGQLCTWVDFIKSYEPSHGQGHPFLYDNKLLANIMAYYIKTGKFKHT